MATILIVDDRPTNRQFLLTLLGYSDHRLLEAANGADALERVRAERPDLVITDILMPTMDGYEFVRHLRADPDLAPMPVIFYTATYSEPQAKALADSCGVQIVLPKPCDPERILAAVNEALGETSATSAPRIAEIKGAGKPGEPHRVDDKLAEYVNELQSVKSKFDDIVEGSVKLRDKRDQVRKLSERFSENVMSLQRIASRLSAIIEVGMEMTAERNPARLVELFFAAACDIIDSKYAAVGMLDEQERELGFVFTKGVEARMYRDAGRKGVLGALLAGHGQVRGQSANARIGADELPPGHPRVRNFLGIPVASRERVYGWLTFGDKRGEGEFTEEDVRLAGMMAAKLAVLYENAVLYDVIQRHAAQLQVEIAERRRAEQTVRESEVKFRELIEQASDGIFVTDSQGNFKLVNPRFCEMLGYREDALLRLNAVDTYAEEEKALIAQRIADLGEVKSRLFERAMRRKDGTFFPVEISVRRLSDGTNQGIVRDVTERKKAAKALADSCGVQIVLPKPCDPERILAAVNEALGETSATSAPRIAEIKGAGKPGEPHRVDDKLAEYVNELQSVKSKFDDIVEGSVKLRDKRDQVRKLSERFSENVMSLQRIASRLSAIIEVGMEMTAERNPARLVELFFAAACDIIDSKYAAVGMLDEQERELGFVFTKGVEARMYRDAGRKGVLGALLAGHGQVRGQSANARIGADELPPGHPRVRNFLGIPVASRERVYGWLTFADKRGEGEFTEEDERLAGMMAAKLAVLYENAVLYDVIQRHAAQLQVEIAERRRAEQTVRESEVKFRELIEQASDGIFVTDSQGNFKLVNPRFCEMLGYREDALLRLNAVDTYAEEEKALIAQRIADLGEVKSRLFERAMRRKDGTFFPVEISVRRLSDGTNQGIVRDVTERKKAQQALAESEAALHRAQLLAKLAHVITQPDGSFERWSDTLPQLIGVEPAQMPRSTREWLDLLHPEDRARFRSTAIEAGRKGAREEVEYRLKRADGAWIHVLQVIEPLQSQAGAEGRKRWFSTLQDVTEQKQAQEELAESEFRFRQLTENITEVFWLTDPFKSEMLYISAAYEKIWGRSCQALYASPRDWVEAIHPEDRRRVLEAAIAKQARGDYDEEYRIVRPDASTRWIRDRAFPVSDSEGRVYRIAGVAEDITERKQAEDKIRRLNRVYAVLSGINALIVRVRDRNELFQGACRIAVEDG
ncbi:MAG: PAS domain S-box protein, partial [Betaproteobacteria bacterium]